MIYSTYQKYLQFQKRVSKHTFKAYTVDIETFFQSYDEGIDLESIDVQYVQEITFRDIRNWVVVLSNRGIDARSIHRKISSLNSFFKFLTRNSYIIANPVSKIILPKTKKRLPSFLTEEQMIDIEADTNQDSIDLFNKTLVLELLYQTGMRANELVTLKANNIYFEKEQIKVLGKGNKERILPISNKLVSQIQDYIQLKLSLNFTHTDTLLITPSGRSVYYQYIYRLVKHELQKHTSKAAVHPHLLRHTFASHLLNNGADLNSIKELLGHSSLSSTQIYTHNSIKKLQDVYKKAHPKA